jgi:2,3-bisphosphoglycerate-dependent phosphoglycerate mutase
LNNSTRHLYLIRHCAAAGQEPDAPLTDTGARQAEALADVLAATKIDRIVSSPFRRARDSIAPLAERAGLIVDVDDRFAERALGSGFEDWRQALRATFDDPNLCFDGGESSAMAMARGVAALQDALDVGGVTAIVTHGNLLTLLLRHYNSNVSYAEWERLTNPDIYRVVLAEDGVVAERIWR